MIPGEYLLSTAPVVCNEGRRTVSLVVANTGDRPVQVGSHFHFFEVNKALIFDRRAALGMRLNIPAGATVRFEPGDEKEVSLVPIAGLQNVAGLNNLTRGSVIGAKRRAECLNRARDNGFMDVTTADAEVEHCVGTKAADAGVDHFMGVKATDAGVDQEGVR